VQYLAIELHALVALAVAAAAGAAALQLAGDHIAAD